VGGGGGDKGFWSIYPDFRVTSPKYHYFPSNCFLHYFVEFLLHFLCYKDKKIVDEMKKRDEKRFKISDSNDDGFLDEEELAIFTHPEESPRMTSLLVQVR
jgi:hypothetical protein